MRALLVSLFISLISCSYSMADFKVGVAKVDMSPKEFEQYVSGNRYKKGDPFWDTGVDRLFDFEEPGALGADGQPGRAGVDDDQDGKIDNCDREGCGEYGAKGSDDLLDPNGDNYHKKTNKRGTEGNQKFEFVHLGGFSPYNPWSANRIMNGIHDPIWSRALVFEMDGQFIVLVSTDLPGLTWKHMNPVRRRLQKVLGIPYENIVLSSTHDHQAPDAAGYWVSLLKGNNRWFTDQVKEAMFESVVAAFHNRKSAKMRSVTTEHHACYDSAKRELKYLKDCHFPSSEFELAKNPDLYDRWILQRDMRDPVVLNPEIVVADFVETDSEKPIATFVNWSDHPETFASGNNLLSSDFPHYVREFLEKKLGGTAVYFSGTVGCQIGALRDLEVPEWTETMKPVFEEDGFPAMVIKGEEKVRSIGYEIGSVALKAIEKESFVTPDKFWIKTSMIRIPVNNAIHALMTRNVWHKNVEKPDRMSFKGLKCLTTLGCVKQDISVLQIGNLGLVTSPGEMDPSYLHGREEVTIDYNDYGGKGKWLYPAMPGFKKYMPGRDRAVLGQAHNYLSYLVHRADNLGWANTKHPNHYEELVTVGYDFGDDVGNHIQKELGSDEIYSKKGYLPRSPWRWSWGIFKAVREKFLRRD